MNCASNPFADQDAAGGGAALAGGAERAPERAFDGKIEIGIVDDDHGILAAELERARLEAGGSGHADECGRLHWIR